MTHIISKNAFSSHCLQIDAGYMEKFPFFGSMDDFVSPTPFFVWQQEVPVTEERG